VKLAQASSRPTVAVTAASPEAAMRREGLVADHAYTVLDAYERSGVRYVQLRNPWGQFEPKGHGKNDGIFEMTLSAFKTRFAYACQA
jgi:Calpain family cysteine protease